MALQWRGKGGLHGRELRQPWAGSSLRSPMTHLLLPSPSIVVPSHHLTSPTPTPSTHKYLIHSFPQIVDQQSHRVWNFPKSQKRIFSKKVVEVYPKGSLTLPIIQMFLRIVIKRHIDFFELRIEGSWFWSSDISITLLGSFHEGLAASSGWFWLRGKFIKTFSEATTFWLFINFPILPLLTLTSLCFIL